MSLARIVAPLLAAAACLGIWILWGERGHLRGTPLWDVRLVVLAAAAFLVLTFAEWLTRRFATAADPDGADDA